jgi:hypothetical protein
MRPSASARLLFSFIMLGVVAVVADAPLSAVALENRPPRLRASVADLYCRGDYVVIRIRAIDPDGDPLIYGVDASGAALPTGLALGRKNGRIRGVLRRTGDEGSSTGYDVVVTATDPGGLSGTLPIHIFSIACEEPRISLFTLVDAEQDRDVRILKDGDTLSLSELPRRLNVRTDAYPETLAESFYGGIVESVRFELDGVPVRTENAQPFAPGGDTDGNYATFALTLGSHTLTAIPFDGASASGKQGEVKSVSFEVIP